MGFSSPNASGNAGQRARTRIVGEVVRLFGYCDWRDRKVVARQTVVRSV